MDFFKNLSNGFVGQAASQPGAAKTEETSSTDANLMEGHDMSKMMSMFQEAMSSDPKMKQKADSIWKFLDDLYKNNPKEYRQFVNKHISEGKEEIKKEEEEEIKTKGIQSEPLICVKIRLFELKTGHKKAEQNTKMDIKLFEFDSSEEIKKDGESSTGEKHLASPCIYINICHSSKVKSPLNKDRTYADVKDDKTWAIIPVSYGKESETDDFIIYDAHINSGIVEK